MNKNIIVFLAVLAVGGGAFFGGIKYQESKSASMPTLGKNFQAERGGAQTPNGSRNAAGIASGEIIGIDEDSITVKTQTGGSKIVFFSEQTKIGNFTDATADDLSLGKNVMASGTAGGDGSIVAQNIQIGVQNFKPEITENKPADLPAE